MMKNIFLFFSTFLSIHLFAELPQGFHKEEARDMLAICNSFTFIDLYNSDAEILPPGYEKRYTSGVFGMDNKFQIFQKGNVAVINLRGSTDKKISWLENTYSSMIPATGVIKASGENFAYCFAQDTNAAVHAGYALGIAYLANDILFHIKLLNKEDIYHIIITGHSQGGALTNMLRAYLANLPEGIISKRNVFKSYSFAAPMVGNKEFAAEYNLLLCSDHRNINIVNIADPMPKFPLSYNEDLLSDNLKNLIFNGESFDIKRTISESFIQLFEKDIIRYMNKLGTSTTSQITKDLGPIEMPEYVQDINYCKLDEQIEINPVDFPMILKDSSILQNDSLMAIYMRDDDGRFINNELYIKESWAYQHKPYNYYVSFLKMYFPEEYDALERKYLLENL